MPSELALQIIGAVEAAPGVTVVSDDSTDESVSLLHRVLDKRVWVGVLHYILIRKTCWEAHTCQEYFLKGSKIVYGWNFILDPAPGHTIEEAVSECSKLLREAANVVPRTTVRSSGGTRGEVQLHGAGPWRNAPAVFNPGAAGPELGGASHKGAFTIKDRG